MQPVPDGARAESVADFQHELCTAALTPSRVPERLKTAVCEIVDEMRAAGKKPEEVIVAVRALCVDGGLASARYSSAQRERNVYGMVDKLVTLCISRYFAT